MGINTVPTTVVFEDYSPSQSPSLGGFLSLLIPAVIGGFAYDLVDGITQNPVFTIALGLAVAIMTRKTSASISTAGLVISAIGIAQYIRQLTLKLESE